MKQEIWDKVKRINSKIYKKAKKNTKGKKSSTKDTETEGPRKPRIDWSKLPIKRPKLKKSSST